MDNTLALVHKLHAESHAGLLFCFKALRIFNFDYQKALDYLQSDAFRNSREIHKR